MLLNMSVIEKIIARQILDSRGLPTVEVDLFCQSGVWARASVPSGASRGSREAVELRDGEAGHFLGKGVKRAVSNIEKVIAPKLLGMEVSDQKAIDSALLELDGSKNKSSLGANSLLAVSLAACRTAARAGAMPLWQYLLDELKVPNAVGGRPLLPLPLMNIVNGGKHAANKLDIQEFMILPHLKGASFGEKLRAGAEVFHNLKKILQAKDQNTNVGDEGGFAPQLKDHQQVLDFICQAIEQAGYRAGEEVGLALDAAASEFYSEGEYHMQGKSYSSGQMIEYYQDLLAKYPLRSIEDGLAEDDLTGWEQLTSKLGERVLLVGDDLFVTNKKILQRGIARREANAILIKPNQIGTLSETLETVDLAFKNNFKVVVSHRSGETGDSFIADLAVAIGCGYLKAGSVCRSERVEKYNRLLRIEETMEREA